MATVTRKNLGVSISGSGILANSATFSISAQSESRRMIGANPEWGHSGPLMATVTLRGTLSENWVWLFNAATGENSGGFPMQLGTVNLENVYLREFEIRGGTHTPLEVAANFVTWNAPTGSFNTGFQASSGAEHVYHSVVSDFNFTGITVPDSFVYKVQAERVPRFLLGAVNPVVRLGRLEKEINLEGYNIPLFINYDGGTGSVNFNLRHTTGSANQLNVYVSGEVSAQDLSLDETLRANITIKQYIR